MEGGRKKKESFLRGFDGEVAVRRKEAEEVGTPDKGKELSLAHWGYIKQLLEVHSTPDDLVELIRFHYCSAFEHGYKHGREDSTP